MPIAQTENLIRYVINADGKTTDVIVPVELLRQLINSVDSKELQANLKTLYSNQNIDIDALADYLSTLARIGTEAILVEDFKTDSGLAWVDEQEPKAQILADLQESLRQAAIEQTFPISQLWQDIIT